MASQSPYTRDAGWLEIDDTQLIIVIALYLTLFFEFTNISLLAVRAVLPTRLLRNHYAMFPCVSLKQGISRHFNPDGIERCLADRPKPRLTGLLNWPFEGEAT